MVALAGVLAGTAVRRNVTCAWAVKFSKASSSESSFFMEQSGRATGGKVTGGEPVSRVTKTLKTGLRVDFAATFEQFSGESVLAATISRHSDYA